MYKLTFPIILSIIGPIFEQARETTKHAYNFHGAK